MARIDLTGQRFGRLVAIKDAGYTKNHSRVWECKCDCGNTAFVKAESLKYGEIKSCGCLRSDISHENLKKAYKWSQAYDCKEHTRLSALSQKIHSNNKSGVKGVQWDKSKSGSQCYGLREFAFYIQDLTRKKTPLGHDARLKRSISTQF